MEQDFTLKDDPMVVVNTTKRERYADIVNPVQPGLHVYMFPKDLKPTKGEMEYTRLRYYRTMIYSSAGFLLAGILYLYTSKQKLPLLPIILAPALPLLMKSLENPDIRPLEIRSNDITTAESLRPHPGIDPNQPFLVVGKKNVFDYIVELFAIPFMSLYLMTCSPQTREWTKQQMASGYGFGRGFARDSFSRLEHQETFIRSLPVITYESSKT